MQDGRTPRRHHRRAVDVSVRVSTIDSEVDPETGDRYFRESEETCATLSPGGAFIRTREPLTPGHRILLAIHVPGAQDPIEATGRVAWVKPELVRRGPNATPHNGAGVEFTDDDPATQRAIVRYLERARAPRRIGPRDDARATRSPVPQGGPLASE